MRSSDKVVLGERGSARFFWGRIVCPTELALELDYCNLYDLRSAVLLVEFRRLAEEPKAVAVRME